MSDTQAPEIDFYTMSNLYPEDTGLPFTVWISVQGNARHDVRVKVSMHRKIQPEEELISVAIRPKIRMVQGTMTAPEFRLLERWIEMNREMLIQYWNQDIGTVQALSLIRKIDS